MVDERDATGEERERVREMEGTVQTVASVGRFVAQAARWGERDGLTCRPASLPWGGFSVPLPSIFLKAVRWEGILHRDMPVSVRATGGSPSPRFVQEGM